VWIAVSADMGDGLVSDLAEEKARLVRWGPRPATAIVKLGLTVEQAGRQGPVPAMARPVIARPSPGVWRHCGGGWSVTNGIC